MIRLGVVDPEPEDLTAMVENVRWVILRVPL